MLKYDEEKGFGFIKPDRGSEDLHLGLEDGGRCT